MLSQQKDSFYIGKYDPFLQGKDVEVTKALNSRDYKKKKDMMMQHENMMHEEMMRRQMIMENMQMLQGWAQRDMEMSG